MLSIFYALHRNTLNHQQLRATSSSGQVIAHYNSTVTNLASGNTIDTLFAKLGYIMTTSFVTVLTATLTTMRNPPSLNVASYRALNPIATTRTDIRSLATITEVTLTIPTHHANLRTTARISAVIVSQYTITQPSLLPDCQG
jgi:hypothetical protein